MPFKFTMHFSLDTMQNATSPKSRLAHWTERHFVNSDTLDGANSIIMNAGAPAGGTGILAQRAALLPGTGLIYKYTLQAYKLGPDNIEVPASSAEPFLVEFKGPDGTVCDIPQQGLLCSIALGGGHPARPRFILRGIPDDRVLRGEFSATAAYRRALTAFLNGLAPSYGTYVDERTTAQGRGQPVDEIDLDGTVWGHEAITVVAVGDLAKILRTTNSDGRRTGGVYRVDDRDDANGSIELGDWDRGDTKGGSIRRFRRVFASYAPGTGQFIHQATRKVGSARDYLGRNKQKT